MFFNSFFVLDTISKTQLFPLNREWITLSGTDEDCIDRCEYCLTWESCCQWDECLSWEYMRLFEGFLDEKYSWLCRTNTDVCISRSESVESLWITEEAQRDSIDIECFFSEFQIDHISFPLNNKICRVVHDLGWPCLHHIREDHTSRTHLIQCAYKCYWQSQRNENSTDVFASIRTFIGCKKIFHNSGK